MAEHERRYQAFPIPAVGAVIINDDDVLLVQRGQEPAKGQWTLPGGVIEVGETPEEALIREIQEECHLRIHVRSIVQVVNKIIKDEKRGIIYHYLILDYLAYCQSPQNCRQFSLTPDSDVMDARWVPLEEIASYDVTDGLIEVIDEAVHIHQSCVSDSA